MQKLFTKGQAGESVFAILRLIYFTILFLGILFIHASCKQQTVSDHQNARLFIHTARILEDPSCLAYSDSIHGATQNAIDLTKFTQEQLSSCFFSLPDSKTPAFKLTLNQDSKLITISTLNWVGKSTFTAQYTVLVYDKGVFRPGTLTIEATYV